MSLLICLAAAVIDGDGIRCRNLGDVRLLGIDAPDYQLALRDCFRLGLLDDSIGALGLECSP